MAQHGKRTRGDVPPESVLRHDSKRRLQEASTASEAQPTRAADSAQTEQLSSTDEAKRTLPTLIHNFLTQKQLVELRSQAPAEYEPSVVINDEREVVEDPGRTSTQRHLQLRIGRDLAQQLSRHMRTSLTYDGDGSWVRYTSGQKYDLHGDAAGLARGAGRDWTLLVCVEQATKGGATHFPHLKTEYLLEPGDALLWSNFDKHGRDDETMDHAALPVEAGVKLVINAWFSAEATHGLKDDIWNDEGPDVFDIDDLGSDAEDFGNKKDIGSEEATKTTSGASSKVTKTDLGSDADDLETNNEENTRTKRNLERS